MLTPSGSASIHSDLVDRSMGSNYNVWQTKHFNEISIDGLCGIIANIVLSENKLSCNNSDGDND